MVNQIHARISTKTNLDAMDALYAMPNSTVLTDSAWLVGFSRFVKTYESDLPEHRYLATELEMWSERCRQINVPPPLTVQDLLTYFDNLSFPNILTAFKVFATIPVTTCTSERSISTLRLLKTYLRNTMTESRLLGLALLNVHREINLDIDAVINRFGMIHPRRMMLADILNID